MLILSRKNQESVVVGGGGGVDSLIKITVLEVAGSRVKLGFEADSGIPVHRLEVWEQMRVKGQSDGRGADPDAPPVRSR